VLAPVAHPGTEKATRRTGAGALRELRETIIRLLGEPGETMCVECVAGALGRQVGIVMMTILGFDDRVASFHGVCSSCHGRALVIRRADISGQRPRPNR
jgi:hypothetical protein